MIDTQLASFLEEGIFIALATRNERLEPNGARVVAVAVEPDGVHVQAFVTKTGARNVLPDLESNGQVAICFARPPDERACQIKGECAGTRDAGAHERELVEAQAGRLGERLIAIGFERASFEHWPTWPCVAIRVRVNAIFNQTPGPGAGGPLT